MTLEELEARRDEIRAQLATGANWVQYNGPGGSKTVGINPATLEKELTRIENEIRALSGARTRRRVTVHSRSGF